MKTKTIMKQPLETMNNHEKSLKTMRNHENHIKPIDKNHANHENSFKKYRFHVVCTPNHWKSQSPEGTIHDPVVSHIGGYTTQSCTQNWATRPSRVPTTCVHDVVVYQIRVYATSRVTGPLLHD